MSDVSKSLVERIERLEAREHALRVMLATAIKITGSSKDASLPAVLSALELAVQTAQKMNAPSETILCIKEVLSDAKRSL